jgi:hypothetical protein
MSASGRRKGVCKSKEEGCLQLEGGMVSTIRRRKDVCKWKEEGCLQVEGGRVSASRRGRMSTSRMRKGVYN